MIDFIKEILLEFFKSSSYLAILFKDLVMLLVILLDRELFGKS